MKKSIKIKKSMRHKTIMIPLAAVMVMGMGTGSVLAVKQTSRQDFSEEQLQILEQAQELFHSGDREGGIALLEEVGIKNPLKNPRPGSATPEDRQAVRAALEADNYEAFLAVAQKGPFGDEVTEEIFEVLVEAHKLKQEGDRDEAREILEEVGIERGSHNKKRGRDHRGKFQDLTEQQQQVIRAFGNDREAVRLYFEEEGIE